MELKNGIQILLGEEVFKSLIKTVKIKEDTGSVP